MTAAMSIILASITVVFGGLIFYALYKGYGVKTALKWLWLSFSFEAQKPEVAEKTPPIFPNKV